MDKHLNTFHAYRHGSSRDSERESVLEDNVTRALMIVLKSSSVLTREFLTKFACIDSRGPYEYDLQSKLQDVKSGDKNSQRIFGKRLIVIDKRAERPSPMEMDDGMLNDFESRLKDDRSRKRLQNNLLRLCNSIRGGSLEGQEIERRLKIAIGIEEENTNDLDLGNPDLPAYLYGLTLGSRPDASIATDKVEVLFENKLYGGVPDVQVRRHLRESFGEEYQPEYLVRPSPMCTGNGNQIPVLIWSWNDAFDFFGRALNDEDIHLDPVSQFLESELLEYLAKGNFGPVKFTGDDFADWKLDANGDSKIALHDRIRELGEALADELGEHRMISQNRTHGYLGINILSDEYQCESAVQVPHYSLALVRDKGLDLFITCESKPLSEKLLKNREELERSLADVLWEMGDLSKLTLKTTKRLFKLPGASDYFDHSEVNLDKCVTKSGVSASVRKIFDDLEYLRSPETKAKALKERKNDKPEVKTVHGTHGFSYIWDVMTLEKWGTAIVEQVINRARRMRPYYEVITEVYRSK